MMSVLILTFFLSISNTVFRQKEKETRIERLTMMRKGARKGASIFYLTFLMFLSTNTVLGQLEGGCWGGNATFIREHEMNRNLKTPYTYIICPGTKIQSGTEIREDNHAVGFEGNSFPIMLKSKARIQCGQDGDPANNCIVDGIGSYGLLLEPLQLLRKLSIWDETKPNLKDVEVVGMTFQDFSFDGQKQSMVSLAATHGSLAFERCIFQSSSNSQPMFNMKQLIDRNKGKDLTVSFRRCKFEGLQLPRDDIINDGGLHLLRFVGNKFDQSFALDLANTKFNAVFDRTSFSDISTNSESDAENMSRSLINFVSSGKLTLKDVCFNNIKVSTMDSSDIVRASALAELDISNVYVDTETTTYFPSGSTPECSFMSIVKANEDETSYTRSQCGPEPDTSYCAADTTYAPTTTPTKAPVVTLSPTRTPTLPPVPTSPPTNNPTPPPVATSSPTDAPTPQPVTKSPSNVDFLINSVNILIDDKNCTNHNIELSACFSENPQECENCQTKHPILNVNNLNLGYSFEDEMKEKICPEMEAFSKYCGCKACEAERTAVFKCHCGNPEELSVSSNSGSQNNLLIIIPTILTILPLSAYFTL